MGGTPTNLPNPIGPAQSPNGFERRPVPRRAHLEVAADGICAQFNNAPPPEAPDLILVLYALRLDLVDPAGHANEGGGRGGARFTGLGSLSAH